jgi:hypothetical protein
MGNEWLIWNSRSGHEFGFYHGETEEDALKALMADGGFTGPIDPDIRAKKSHGETYEQLCTWLEDQCHEIRGEDFYETAREWADTGLGFDACIDYIEVGCFCPQSAKILSDEGIAPDLLDLTIEGRHTLGWAYSANTITLEALKRAIA